jgi:diacylglycerol kinase family enzyme
MNHQQPKKKQTSTEMVLIVNPNSCGGATGKNWGNFYNQIKEIVGENPEVVFSQRPGDGTTLTRHFLRRGFKEVVGFGGDGTLNEVANGFFEEITLGNNNSPGNYNTTTQTSSLPILKSINPEATMGLIPAGSRNVLAKSLDLSVDGIIESCQSFVKAKPRKIDVIAAIITRVPEAEALSKETSTDPKIASRIFLNAAEIGVGAEIIDRSKTVRDKIKSRFISTISSVIATLPTYESNLCEVSVDDGNRSLLSKITMGVVANGKYLGGGFIAAPQARISDGLLDLTILKNSGSFKMLDEFMGMRGNTGHTQEDNDIFYTQAKKVSIRSKERDISVTLDGEPIGILPATFQVYHDALTIKV